MTHTKQGGRILSRFVLEIAGCAALWTPANIVEDAIAAVRAQVGDANVLLIGLSGRGPIKFAQRFGPIPLGDIPIYFELPQLRDYQSEADGIRMTSATTCEALAHVRIAAVNDRLGLDLPEEEDFETIGGFVFHQCGRIPEVGERIESHGVAIEVLAATRRRIDLVRVERIAADHADGR